jgi:peptidoglycan/LPS O-acetylase OafA/YrhL
MAALAVSAESSGRPGEASNARHLPVLDGLRGLAILLVMQHHFWGLAFGLGGRAPTLAIDLHMRALFAVGWSGVDLFFVLSGFLITGILCDAKRSNFYFRNFYARRLLRIFPLYYAFLVFALFLLPNFHRLVGPDQVSQLRASQFWYWTYTMNIGSAVKQFHTQVPIVHSQFWSLAVEEQFYLVWPLLILLLSRRTMTVVCGVLVGAALAVRFVLVDPISASFANLNAAHVLLPARIDTLALGALIALMVRGGSDLIPFRRYAFPVAAGSLLVLTVLFVRHHGLSVLDRDVATIGFSALALFFAALLLLVVSSVPGSALHRVFTSSGLRMLGRYSYAIYVCHLLLAFELAAEFVRHDVSRTVFGSQIPLNIVFSLVCTAGSIAVAWLSWHFFEKQVLKLKRYVPYGRPRPAVERPAVAERPMLAAP